MPRIKKKDYNMLIESARIQLLLKYPFFGRVATYLGWEHSEEVPTAQTDGMKVTFGHELLDSLTEEELIFVAAHEVHHVIKRHHFRIKNRDPQKWNMATDYQINDELEKCGLQPPKNKKVDVLLDKKYDSEMLEETIYKEIPDPPEGSEYQGIGEVVACPHDEGSIEGERINANIDRAVEAATQYARERGNLPGFLEKYTNQNKEPVVNWKNRLRRFMMPLIARDVSWRTPNRRLLATGNYFPGPFKDGVGKIFIAVDTSGSVSDNEVHQFMSEMEFICSEVNPEKTTVYYFCSDIWRKDEFLMGETFEIPKDVQRGGTALTPVLKEIKDSGEKPMCLIVLSDLYIEEVEEPPYPVIALSTTEEVLPFGETINVQL